MTRNLLRTLLLALLAFIGPAPPDLVPSLSPVGAAWADDDDDGGGGDDSDDDDSDDDDDDDGARGQTGSGGDGRSGDRTGGPRGPTQRQSAPGAAAPAVPLPIAVADEIVALALDEADLSILTGQGFAVIEEVSLPGLRATPRRLRIPPGATLIAAREIVRALPTGQDADFNHYYRSEQGFPENCAGAECPAREMIGWPRLPERGSACGRGVVIGMIDTGINEDHTTFEGAALEVIRLSPDDLDPSGAAHGTAVAALLVGDPATRSPGLVPGSQLIAVDAFHRSGSDERADIFTLTEALAALADRGARVINLSLAGPSNGVLAEVINRLVVDEDIVVVSAVGNAGPRAEPAYPAAYDQVIAVTAVDRAGRIYRRAVQGEHVDLAAPGVDVWTAASVSGARFKTGTSFAVPFVSAAAAMLREARPELTAPEVAGELRRLARDLGEPGPDPIFGAGLLSLGGICDDEA